MGDAKRRGTFEQREAEAIAREAERLRNLLPRPTYRHSARTMGILAAIAGIGMGASIAPAREKPLSEMTLEDFE